MSNFLFGGGARGNTNARLGMLDDTVNSLRPNKSAGAFAQRGSGGVGFYVPKSKGVSAPFYFPLTPFADASTHANPKVTITYGTYALTVPTISGTALVPTTASNVITLGASDVLVYMQCDFTYANALLTIVDAEIKSSTSSTPPPTTITGTGMGNGSGTLYQSLFGVTIYAPVGAGPYRVVAAPGTTGSQNFNVCCDPSGGTNDSISGPWGV